MHRQHACAVLTDCVHMHDRMLRRGMVKEVTSVQNLFSAAVHVERPRETGRTTTHCFWEIDSIRRAHARRAPAAVADTEAAAIHFCSPSTPSSNIAGQRAWRE